MKRLLTAITIFLLPALSAFAQERNRGLLLNGSVQRVTTECIKGEWVAAIQLYLQFHNDSASPVILYPPSNMFAAAVKYGTGDKSFSTVDSFRYRPYLNDPFGEMTDEDFDWVSRIPRRLDVDNPGEAGMLLTIEPGGYYEFVDTVWPKSGFKIDVTPITLPSRYKNKPPDFMLNQPCGLTRATVTPEYRSFRIRYDLGLRKYRDATDLLTKLRTRWKPFGSFVLSSNDDIAFETEEIILDIKK